MRTETRTWRRRKRLEREGVTAALLLVLPAVATLIIFRVYPLVLAAILSFERWDGITPPQWAGLQNYDALVHDQLLLTGVRNNLLILVVLEASTVFSYLIAVALHARMPGARIFRALFLLPAVLSPYVIGVFWDQILDYQGPLNRILRDVGLPQFALVWLAGQLSSKIWLMAIVVWSVFGIGVVLFLAAFATLDPDLTDAARVDGASPLQAQRHVVLPQVSRVYALWAIVIVITDFTGLTPLIIALTNGGPGNATMEVGLRLYEAAFSDGNYGYASAIGIATLVAVAVIIFALWLLVRLWMARDRVQSLLARAFVHTARGNAAEADIRAVFRSGQRW